MDQYDQYEPTGEITLARRGIAALTLLKELETGPDPGPLTPAQRQVLSGWCGWGPLARALDHDSDPAWQDLRAQVHNLIGYSRLDTARDVCDTAFYTPQAVRRAMWDLAAQLGFAGGKVLEPGCGAGRFIGSAPPGLDCDWTGVEYDRHSARIAQLLYPDAQVIGQRLEKTPLREGGYSLAIGNVPFSSQGVYDPNCPDKITSLHGYFLWRALHALHPGGLAIFVTSRYVLDAVTTPERAELAKVGLFLGAARLPGSALAPGGTRVVADIVVFRRRHGTRERDLDDRWLAPAAIPPPPGGTEDRAAGLQTPVAAYFQGNPHMVLGRMTDRRGHRHGMTLDVTLPDGEDLAACLDVALSDLAGRVTAAGLGWQARPAIPGPGLDDDADADPDIDPACDGAFTLHDDGRISQQRDGRHHAVAFDAQLADLIRLKGSVTALFAAEADEQVSANARERLRQAALRDYQSYTARYGWLGASDLAVRPDPDNPGETVTVRTRQARAVRRFTQDPDWPTVLAAEIWDDETLEGRPADVLLRRTGGRPARKDRTDDPAEALALCLDRCGQVDLDVIAGLLSCDPAEAAGRLGPLAWEDPEEPGTWLAADEYLSGNVRKKLAAARAAEEDDPGRWAGQVAALEAAQPEDLTPEQINVGLGAPWLPPEVIHRFTCDLLGVREWDERYVTVTYEPYTATWTVRAETSIRALPAAKSTWGTTRVNAVNLIEDACNSVTPTVTDPAEVDGKKAYVKNVTETALAADKIRDLEEKFAEWWAEDAARAERLCRIYNDRFNACRVRQFDGGLLTFTGLVPGWAEKIYPSQRDMIWRNVCTGTTLCGHVVGAGKTFIAVGTAMKLRELGFVRKPAMLVPNHLLEQTAAEARRYFPGAKILMVTPEDLNPARRKYFAAKCAARDWDLVVMTHQQWMALPVSPELADEYYADLLDELDEMMASPAIEESRATGKILARKRRRLLAKMDKIADLPRDGGLVFEQTGIDYVIADEAHAYKNLEFSARAEGFNTTGSQRADDMLLKLTWLRKQSPDGRAGMLMTGTPISNALSELWILFRYCAPELLSEQELISFDAFAAQYIRWQTATEVAPDGGGFRSYRRPRLFVNLPELRQMLWQFADIKTKEDLALDGPEVTVEHVICAGPPELAPFTADLVKRSDDIRNGTVSSLEDNMLKVCGDGRAAALWMPLVGITPTGPGKIERCAANVAKLYHQHKDQLYPDRKGGFLFHPRPGALHVIFCDMGTPKEHDGDGGVYWYLKRLLSHAGVPEREIRFIHEAKSHAARRDLFADCRNGLVSVLIGSTEKMGTGVNVQRRLASIHELDHPWRPADVQQRHGRGDRPGNENGRLLIFRYATEGSFDSYTLQGLERKLRFIVQVLTGAAHIREVEAADNPQVLSYGQIKAMATGQPLLMMLSEVNAQIARLRNSSAGHKRSRQQLAAEQSSQLRRAQGWKDAAKTLRGIAAKAAEQPDPVLNPDAGGRLTDPDEIAAHVGEAMARARRNRDPRVKFGSWRGVWLSAELAYYKQGPPRLAGEMRRGSWEKDGIPVPLFGAWDRKTGPAAVIAAFEEAIGAAEDKAAECLVKAAECARRAEEITPFLNVEWPGKAELAEALKRRNEIEKEIDMQVKDSRKVPEPA